MRELSIKRVINRVPENPA